MFLGSPLGWVDLPCIFLQFPPKRAILSCTKYKPYYVWAFLIHCQNVRLGSVTCLLVHPTCLMLLSLGIYS